MGGSSSSAADQANANEQAREAAIAKSQAAINHVFNSPKRAADIADYVKATRTFYQGQLDQQKSVNDRQLRFALARGGLTGGSEQVDKQALADRDYTQGLLSVSQKARGAGANLESQDQDARARLIALATSGLDSTTAAQQSAAALRTSLESANAANAPNALGDVFSDFSKFYDNTQLLQNQRKANAAAGLTPYQPVYGTPGTPITSPGNNNWYGGP